MRTTIDLPDDLHQRVQAIARGSGSSVSGTITQLLRSALAVPGPVVVMTSPRTGLQVASIGRPVTSSDVRLVES